MQVQNKKLAFSQLHEFQYCISIFKNHQRYFWSIAAHS